MDTDSSPINQTPLTRRSARCQSFGRARLFVPDDLELTDLHDVFLAMLNWDDDPDFIIRILESIPKRGQTTSVGTTDKSLIRKSIELPPL